MGERLGGAAGLADEDAADTFLAEAVQCFPEIRAFIRVDAARKRDRRPGVGSNGAATTRGHGECPARVHGAPAANVDHEFGVAGEPPRDVEIGVGSGPGVQGRKERQSPVSVSFFQPREREPGRLPVLRLPAGMIAPCRQVGADVGGVGQVQTLATRPVRQGRTGE